MTAAPDPLPLAELRKLAKQAGWEVTTGAPLIVAARIDRCGECGRQVGQSHTRACYTGRYARDNHEGADQTVDADTARAFVRLADTVTAVTVQADEGPTDLGVVIRGEFHASDVELFGKLTRAAETGATSKQGGSPRKTGARKPKGANNK